MSREFTPYTIAEFRTFIQHLQVKRMITHIQIHHTWRPRKTDYNGEKTIEGMWRYHTEQRGWKDIAQHFSVAPDGTIWDGRSLELDPAGISGHNKGGIMFEIIGNFDIGEEKLEGVQLDAIVNAVRLLMLKFHLTDNDIVFHREYSTKTCPGTSISKEWFLNEVNYRNLQEISEPIEPWKMASVNWLYTNHILSSEDWKQKVETGLPLWAEAIVIKRIYEKINKQEKEE